MQLLVSKRPLRGGGRDRTSATTWEKGGKGRITAMVKLHFQVPTKTQAVLRKHPLEKEPTFNLLKSFNISSKPTLCLIYIWRYVFKEVGICIPIPELGSFIKDAKVFVEILLICVFGLKTVKIIVIFLFLL